MSALPEAAAKPRAKGLFVNLLLLAGSFAFFALVIELALRLTGFQYVLRPQDIEFGSPEPVLIKAAFREDDELFWVHPDYPQKIERLAREQPGLLLLGDSCTDYGRWDRQLAALYQARFGRQLEFGNLAVVGWSSYQGRRLLERDVPPMRPKVVVAYFGWNDHWIGFGIEDKNVAGVKRIFSSRYSGLRVVQLLTKAYLAWGTRETALPNRVSLEDFEANLEGMAETAESLGARLMILTAPSNLGASQVLRGLEKRWLRDARELVPMHQAYVEAARRAAAESGAALCDLEAEFATLSPEERGALFMKDGIHFLPPGEARLAGYVFGCLEREGLLPLAP